MKIPFLNFQPIHAPIREEMVQAFEAVYDSNWFILGEQVRRFEQAYAAYNQVSDCAGVSNGLDALHIALKTLGTGPGDEVIVPSNTFIATLLAVSYVGATPVLVEPDIRTYNIDPARIKAAITPRTKVIIPVNLYGQACDLDAIMKIADEHGLKVIEDNAQAQGASFNGKLTGSFGHINATSFYPGKNLGALGDAGAITTNDPALAEKARILLNYGTSKKYVNDEIGFNMRMDECQAAFLSVKLKYLPGWIQGRQAVAAGYDAQLVGVGDLVLPAVLPGATHTYHLYVIRTQYRDQLQQYLTEQGIGTLIHYPIPPHLQKAYRYLGFREGDYPLAETIANTCLSLPVWPGMEAAHISYVTDTIKRFFAGLAVS